MTGQYGSDAQRVGSQRDPSISKSLPGGGRISYQIEGDDLGEAFI